MAAASENGLRPVNGHRSANGKRTWLVIVGLLLAVIVLAAFVSLHHSQVAIRVGTAQRETITASIATNGKIEALNNFQAYAPMPTTVKKIFVQQGAWVKPGEMLLQLDDADARLQAARAEATPVIVHAVSEGDIPAADKTYLSQLVVARTGLSQADAIKRVDDVDGQVKAAWVKAHQVADQASKAASYLSFFTAFSMLVGAFIAAVAATIAGHRRDEGLAQRHRP